MWQTDSSDPGPERGVDAVAASTISRAMGFHFHSVPVPYTPSLREILGGQQRAPTLAEGRSRRHKRPGENASVYAAVIEGPPVSQQDRSQRRQDAKETRLLSGILVCASKEILGGPTAREDQERQMLQLGGNDAGIGCRIRGR